VLLGVIPCAALAQGWKPTKDVEFVVPFGLGGGADLMARVIHKVIADEKLVPVPIAVVNKPGGGGAAGIGYVAASRKADPHTLILINGSTQITPILNPQAKTLTEVTPVMNMMLDDFLLFVRADAPWKSAADFVKDAKSKPAKSVAFSTGGTTDVMAVTVLSKATGVEYNTVGFNSGGEALTALLGGHVQASMGNPLEFMGQLQGGKVRALGVVRDQRFPALKDVPTFQEQGIKTPNFQMWRGVAIPKDAPDAARVYWEGIMTKVNDSAAMKKYYADNVAQAASIPGKQFNEFLARQEKLYRELLGK
ncbi:MAG TPA: tripartite tricarboxylate transporter substrate binding protein, partial [Burkholderiales bacterium]|nr:tripartite tricarboxylate transporter substrate binding protein [Burkholderiales bacterium]